jgi:alcohol dehydrogenase class IV
MVVPDSIAFPSSLEWRSLSLPEIAFGVDSLNSLPATVRRFSEGPALIVSDQGIARAGIIKRVRAQIEAVSVPVEVFDRVEADPCIESVEACVKFARECKAKVLIGIGGGSALDVTKIASFLSVTAGQVNDFFGNGKVPYKGLPMILIPTTAGTGTEMAIGAVVSDTQARLKKAILSKHMLCDVAILDPRLTVSCPPSVTAATGIDALTHAIEVFTNKKAVLFIDEIVLVAIRLLLGNIQRAYQTPEDLEARACMLLGSMYAGIGMQVINNAAVHALSSPFGAMYEVPHGLANALLLPQVMEYNISSCEHKYAQIAELCGLSDPHMAVREKAELAVKKVRETITELHISDQLESLKIHQSDISIMAELSMRVWLMANNPRKMDVADAVAVYEKTFASHHIPIEAS